MKQTATLKKWGTIDGPRGIQLFGEAYGHPNFADGTLVTTSLVVSMTDTEAETRNTFYTLVDKAEVNS